MTLENDLQHLLQMQANMHIHVEISTKDMVHVHAYAYKRTTMLLYLLWPLM